MTTTPPYHIALLASIQTVCEFSEKAYKKRTEYLFGSFNLFILALKPANKLSLTNSDGVLQQKQYSPLQPARSLLRY